MKLSDLPRRIYIDGEPVSDYVMQRRNSEGKDDTQVKKRAGPGKFIHLSYKSRKKVENEKA